MNYPNYIPLISVTFTSIRKDYVFFTILLYRFEVSIFSFLLVLSYKAFKEPREYLGSPGRHFVIGAKEKGRIIYLCN